MFENLSPITLHKSSKYVVFNHKKVFRETCFRVVKFKKLKNVHNFFQHKSQYIKKIMKMQETKKEMQK